MCFEKTDEIYLIDANIILYALNDNKISGNYCKETILYSGKTIATTKQVMAEILQPNNFNIVAIDVKKISPEVDELHYDTLEDLSIADKSLIQCAINNPSVVGIISYDSDIKNVVPTQLIKSEKKFFVGNAKEFLKKINMI